MTMILKNIDAYNDNELTTMLLGKSVKIKNVDGTTNEGVITNFIKAAQAGYAHRGISGMILNGNDEIGISAQNITHIELLDKTLQ